MRIDFINRPMQALSAAAAVLTLTVVLELLYPARPADADVVVSETATAVVPDFGDSSYLPPSLAELNEMLERPLFYNDRRMPEPPSPVAVEAPTPLRLKLEGVAITTESRVAVLRNLENNQLVQLAEGMKHESWTLDSVTADGASFSRGQQVSTLALDPGSGRR